MFNKHSVDIDMHISLPTLHHTHEKHIDSVQAFLQPPTWHPWSPYFLPMCFLASPASPPPISWSLPHSLLIPFPAPVFSISSFSSVTRLPLLLFYFFTFHIPSFIFIHSSFSPEFP
ncbi:UNVERIFIED_CONTAM: hypothetical protein K2H54_074825 [Gekko kuhli]